MSEILLTSSVALATEVMHALLSGTLNEWSYKRMDFPTGEPISGLWEDCDGQRIRSFSKTLKKVRIMKIVPGAIPTQEVYGADYDSSDPSAEMVRTIDFHLGTEKNHMQMIVRVIMECREDLMEDSLLWGEWMLCYIEAITCLKHPDPKLTNYVVLGLNALD